MSATYAEAVDVILGLFKTVWDTSGHIALYENVAGDIPTAVAPWARVTLRNVDGRQGSLAGALGVQRFDRDGLLTVQIFVPAGEGLSEAHTLSKIVADAYEGVAGDNGIWFRNVRVNEIGPDGDWFQTNVLVDFTYDEIK